MEDNEREHLLRRSNRLENVVGGGESRGEGTDSPAVQSDYGGVRDGDTAGGSSQAAVGPIGSDALSAHSSFAALGSESHVSLSQDESEHNYMEVPHDNETILQACVFIEDAINYRSIHHRVDRKSLLLYRFYYSGPAQWFLYLILVVLHILPFFEWPSSLTATSSLKTMGERPELPCGVTEGVEFFCLVMLTADIIMKIYLKGRREFLSSLWLVAYVAIMSITVIDWLVSVIYACREAVRVRRMLRPFFLLQNSSMLKKTVKSIRKTLPQVISVLVLLFMHLYFFAMFGMLLFPKLPKKGNSTTTVDDQGPTERNMYFSTLTDAFMNLLVLLTTANNPDVTLPAYNQNRFYAVFFILFLAIGLYCLMNMLTAVIYNQFRGYFSDSMQASVFRRNLAIRAAFEVLRTRRVSFRYQSSFATASGGVPSSIIRDVIMESYIDKPHRDSILMEMESNPDCVYRYSMFLTLFEILDVDLSKGKKPPIVQRNHRYGKRLQHVFAHSFFTTFGCVIAALNVICITVELAFEYDHISTSRDSYLGIFNMIFVMYYAFEQVAKLWANGWRRYCHDGGNIFDGVITLVLLVAEIVYVSSYGIPYWGKDHETNHGVTLWDFVRIINMLIMIRLVRMIVTQVKPMFIVSTTLIDLIKNLRPFAGILVIIFYVYALIGMELFRGKIVYEPRNATNRTLSYACGEYAQLDYWANNFDDFGAALVVLWDVMVVNNWHIFLHVYSRVMNKWTQLYFITWWLLSVVISLNLFTALILENFIMRWDKQRRPRERTDSTDTTHEFASSFMTVHDMFRSDLQEPSEEALLVELRQHPHFSALV